MTNAIVFIAVFFIAIIALFWASKPVRKRRRKRSWYIGNKRWRRIRARRIRENSRRYGLPKGKCACERCGVVVTGSRIHCDHIRPRKNFKFLQYMYWNTQILCARCNRMKSAKSDGHNWRLLRQMKMHPIVWYLRWRQHRSGRRHARP